MSEISSDSIVAATISNLIAMLIIAIGKRGWRVVVLNVTRAGKSLFRAYSNTRLGCHFSRVIRAVGRFISESIN